MTWWLVLSLIDQSAEVVIQSAELPFESPFQPPRKMEGHNTFIPFHKKARPDHSGNLFATFKEFQSVPGDGAGAAEEPAFAGTTAPARPA
jgi:hypothetical protein